MRNGMFFDDYFIRRVENFRINYRDILDGNYDIDDTGTNKIVINDNSVGINVISSPMNILKISNHVYIKNS